MILKLMLSANDKMSGVIRGAVSKSDSEFDKMQKKIAKVSDSLDTIGKGALVAGGVIAAPLALGVKVAADFGSELSNIKAITGETAENMDKLKKLALKMGADTKFSALEAAQGITELEKAGVSTSQILNGGLSGALSLAAAGDLELADAAEIASTALNAFRKDNLTVAGAANILAGAANASATSVGELKFSLSMASAVASGFGMSFKDVNIALALFAQNGLKGSDAGTSLKSMLMNLQPRTDEQVTAFVKLGLATGKLVKVSKDGKEKYQLLSNAFFDSHGNIKNITEISGVLHDKLKGLTNQQRLYALETMFGADAIRAANILFTEGAQGADKMWSSMSKVTATQVAAEKMNNLKGELEELGGSIETIAISYGDKLTPVIRGLTRGAIAVTNAFGALPEPIQSVIAISSALGAVGLIGIGGLSLGVSGLLKGFNEFAPIYRDTVRFMHKNKLFAAMGLNSTIALAPMIGIISGIAIGAFLIYKYWKPIKGFFRGLWSGIIEGTRPLHPTFNKIAKWMTPIASGVKGMINWFKKISTPINSAGKGAESFGIKAGKAIGFIITGLAKLAKAAWDVIKWTQPLYWIFRGGKWVIETHKKMETPPKGTPKPDKKTKTDGSHFDGLDRVPFDGYIAETHKDEMIVPANQAKSLRQGSLGRDSSIRLTYAPVINNSTIKDVQDLKKVLEEHERKLLAKIKTEQRRKEARSYA